MPSIFPPIFEQEPDAIERRRLLLASSVNKSGKYLQKRLGLRPVHIQTAVIGPLEGDAGGN